MTSPQVRFWRFFFQSSFNKLCFLGTSLEAIQRRFKVGVPLGVIII
jgi:hypothetical protein